MYSHGGISMALTRVKTANISIPETQEAQFVILSALGSDGKPYAIAVDESTGQLPVSSSGAATVKETATLDYVASPVTVAAWVQLIASTSASIREWDIFSPTGETLELGVGAGGAETRFALVAPGGATFSHSLAAGSRVSIRAVSGTANTGRLVLNAWG